ncbi:MAG: HEAT repeat domain-containing protein [Sedimentisphaerales bacterium]|jgi:HEAT repeat protein
MNRLLKIIAVITVIFCGGCETTKGKAPAPAPTAAPAARDAFGEQLNKIKTYDFDKSRVDLIKVSDMIREASGKPEMKAMEKQLDDFLKSDAGYVAKDFVCRELSVAGTEASVPALASMLTDEKVSDIARYALERIPGPAVDDALRSELPKAKGKAKIGIINTLGVRGDKKAVDALAKLAGDSNEMVAVAAVAALGRIDDRTATLAIAMVKDKATGATKTAALDAYLRCADRLAAKGQKDAAGAIYKELYASGEPMIVRVAAARGMLVTAGDKTADVMVEMLKSADKPIQTAAIATLKDAAKTDVIKAVAEQLANLEAEQQSQLISALADCGDKVALPAVLDATKNSHDFVRVAALRAVGTLGDVSSVDMLVETAASKGGDEQKAAQESLYRLKGSDVDEAILKKLPDAELKAKAELVRSCEQRNIKSSVPFLMKTAKDADAKVRIESIKALRALAGPGDIEALIELQLAASGNDRGELEKTVVAATHKIPEDKGQAPSTSSGQAKNVLAALPSAKDVDARCSLLSVLGRIGDEAALPVLRESLGDKEDKIKDAAVRALSDWPTAAPAADLLKVAQTSENPVHKTLALRGYVRLAGLKSNRPAEETMKMYKDAMSLAANVSEKKMVLSGLGSTDSFEAMQMAASYLDDKELKEEAEAAVMKIAEVRAKNTPRSSAQTKDILQKVIDGTTNDSVREQAQKLLKQGK